MGIRPSVTRRGLGIAAGLIVVAGPAGVLFGWDHPLAAATLLILGGGIGFRLGGRLPAAFDNVGKVRRVLWGLAALLAIVQLGRVGVFSGDATAEWASAMPNKELMRHSCLAAYVQAGALAQAGVADVWAEEHWPLYESMEPGGASTVDHLGPWLLDAYEYPPTFLLFPVAVLKLTNDFDLMRGGWYVLRLFIFLAVALAVARAVGGREGARMALVLPVFLISMSPLVELQFGQVHTTAIALSVGGMLALHRGRSWLGACLIAVATVVKIFPGILVLVLLLQGRRRDALRTVGVGVGLVGLGIAVFGLSLHMAFLDHVPRILDGSAFSFALREDLFISRNMAISNLVWKLDLLGVPGMGPAGVEMVGWVWTAVVLALAVRIARGSPGRRLQAMQWLALLNLAALRSPVGPPYVSVAWLWLASMCTPDVRRARRDVPLLVVAWILMMGVPPLPLPVPEIPVTFLTQVTGIGLNLWVAFRRT